MLGSGRYGLIVDRRGMGGGGGGYQGRCGRYCVFSIAYRTGMGALGRRCVCVCVWLLIAYRRGMKGMGGMDWRVGWGVKLDPIFFEQ